MKSIKYIILAAVLFFVFLPSFELSHGAQIPQETIQQVEPANTASRAVGSGGF